MIKNFWIIITLASTVAFNSCLGRSVENLGISANQDDKIKLVIEASVPKSVKSGIIRVEYDFHTYCDNENEHPARPTYNNCREVPNTMGSGVYNISINGQFKEIYCEVNPNGDNYLIIQRRVDGSLDFYRNWTEYENGFGNLSHEFWIGNKLLHQITSNSNYKLRIDLESVDSTKAYAVYDTFFVGSSETKYQLNVSDYTGTAGDSLSYNSGQMFTTFDQDNDEYPKNCAVEFKGAWWYKSCHYANLNGFYYNGHHESYADGVNWQTFKGYHESMKKASMKLY